MSEWKHKIVLNAGESLSFVGSSMKGFMQETDVMTYNVVGSDGAKVGTVVVEDHTAVKGFRRTITVSQKDNEGTVIVHESWTVS
jgi:hypothetical protein